MRWIIATLAIASILCIGTSEVMRCRHFNAKGNADRIKVSVLAGILGNYTNNGDAVKTAYRYHEETNDPELWTAMTIVESQCRSSAVSASGAQGKLQVMPFWKHEPGFEFYSGRHSHLNDTLNFRAAHKVYRRLLDQFNGNKWLAVERYCGIGPAAKRYAEKVKALYHKIKGATEQAVIDHKTSGAS